MKIILLSILISTSVFANEPPKIEPKQTVTEQSNKKRCKFSDLSCQNRNDRPVTRKLKRLSKF